MKDKIKEILVDVYQIDGRLEDEATERILRLFSVSRCITEPKLVKCDNCDEMVEMISTGEFCPCCFC